MPGQPLALRVTCHKSRLYHSDGVAERVAAAVSKKLGKPSKLLKVDEEADLSPQLVVVRFLNDLCTISLDSSGALLHRRGYRLETAKAPLRETLAAGLLLAAKWDQKSPLLDPFCGSGTIPIEAARLARKIAPGSERHFAFMDWRGFDSQTWEKILQETVHQERPCETILHASDRDAGAIRSAQENAKRARVADNIHFECKAFSSLQSSESAGWLITNPPYGVRIHSNADIRNLYSSLGNVLRKNCQNWRFGILCASEELMGLTRLKVEQTLALVNGGVQVKFYTGLIE